MGVRDRALGCSGANLCAAWPSVPPSDANVTTGFATLSGAWQSPAKNLRDFGGVGSRQSSYAGGNAGSDGCDLGGADDGRDREADGGVIVDLDVVRPSSICRRGDHQHPEQVARSTHARCYHERRSALLDRPFHIRKRDGDDLPRPKARHNPWYRPLMTIPRSRRTDLPPLMASSPQ
jgi:hypothetical protein